jgi:hypothetical protein
MTEIDQLTELWRERYGRRAKGGETSLAGYRFQLIVALRDIVQAFLKDKSTEPSIFTEKISDIYQAISDDEILFTQVKRTGSTVSKALEELWAIHALAGEKLPQILPKLRYRILCSRWTLKNISSSITRWSPSSVVDTNLLDSFKKKVTWATEANPLQELLALVANDLEDDEPYHTVLSWIGSLSNPDSGSYEIWSKLISLRNKRQHQIKSRVYLWTSNDHSPETIVGGDVLISQQPKIEHLRRGYFAIRPLYRRIAEDVIKRIASDPRQQDPSLRTPVIWIGGRSGCGKSVALLHILAQLHEEGVAPILWLGNGVNLLPEAVRRVPVTTGDQDQPIIALDDPYAPRTQGDNQPWRDALAELEQLQNRSAQNLPLIICCGPTEQARQLEEDFSDDVSLRILNIPDALDDREALEEWFEQRMGTRPPPAGSGDVLVVQLFFEWRTGEPLPSFAFRFRDRLMEKDPSGKMLDIVYRIVGLNRLYAGYPSAALTAQFDPGQMDAFEDLLREHHFVIDENPERSGVWMTHPHLANALFEAWLPKTNKAHKRWEALKEAMLDALRYGDKPLDKTSPLWALARLSRATGPFSQRIEKENLETVLPGFYKVWRDNSGGSLNISHLPVWIELRFTINNLRLNPDPIDEALNQLLPERVGEVGLRLTCHKVMQYWDRLTDGERSKATLRIRTLLNLAKDWHAWSFIAKDAILHIEDDELRRVIEDRVLSDEQMASKLLFVLLIRRHLGVNREWLLNLTLRWIEQQGTSPTVGPILSLLMRRRDLYFRGETFVTLTLNWIKEQNSYSPEVEKVLKRLLARQLSPKTSADAIYLTIDYIEEQELLPESSFLIAAILRSRVIRKVEGYRIGSSSLVDLAINLGTRWLNLYNNSDKWNYVADRLLRLPQVADLVWARIASQSLARLNVRQQLEDIDYTLVSISYRRSLLNQADSILFLELIRSWLDIVRKKLPDLITQRKIHLISKYLVPALPLVAHLNDSDLRAEIEEIAQDFRTKIHENLLEQFDQNILMLYKLHAWPTQNEGANALRRIGLILNEETLRSKLKRLVSSREAAADLSPLETLNSALKAVSTALDASDYGAAIDLLPVMFPLSVGMGENYSEAVEALAHRLISLQLPIPDRFRFISACDRWAASANPEGTIKSLRRACVYTPEVLNLLAKTEVNIPVRYISESLNFAEQLLKQHIAHAAFYLGPLLVISEKATDESLLTHTQQVTRIYLESPKIAERFKIRLAYLVRELVGGNTPVRLRAAINSLGLQAPWLAEEADAAVDTSDENFRRYLRQAEQLLEQGSLKRSGTFLAPLLVLAANLSRLDLLEEAYKAVSLLLSNPRLSARERDAFVSLCWTLRWLNPDVKDYIFQKLGIGAPLLDELLSQSSPAPPPQLLERSLNNAEQHLQADRLGEAHHILLAILPLASWSDDQTYLNRAVDLASRFLKHPKLSPRLHKRFPEKCFELLEGGLWKDSNTGRQCLAKVGLEVKEKKDISSDLRKP